MPVRPADFSATMMEFSGPLPPPHYFEQVIQIGPGLEGSLTTTAGYPGPGTPVWTERFALSEAHLEWLFNALSDQGLFAQDWPAKREVPVGGASRKLTATSAGRQFLVPPFVEAAQQEALQAMIGAVRALLPNGLAEAMDARRAALVNRPSVPAPLFVGTARPKETLFEENHVAIATFIGTPVAGGTLMAMNAFRTGKAVTGLVVLAFGAILSVIEIYFTLAVTATGSRGANLFSTVVAVFGALVMRGLSAWLQGEEIAAHARAGGPTASGLSAIGIGALYLVALFIAVIALGLLPPR